MIKHKIKLDRRSQWYQSIEPRKRVIRNRWYDPFYEYPISDQKRAASMLDELKEQNMAGIDGSLKSKLSKTVRNRWKYKNFGYTHDQKGRISYGEATSPFGTQRLVVPFPWKLEAMR